MIFLDILRKYDIHVPDCAVVTLGTDGIDPECSNVLCVSFMPLSGEPAPSTVYIEGGDVYTSREYNGINPVTYFNNAVSEKNAARILREKLGKFSVIIGHNILRYSRYPLERLVPEFADKQYLDTFVWARYLYSRVPRIIKGRHPDWDSYQLAVAVSRPTEKYKWGLKDLCQFDLGEMYNQPEVNAVRTKALLTYLLGREAPTPITLPEE